MRGQLKLRDQGKEQPISFVIFLLRTSSVCAALTVGGKGVLSEKSEATQGKIDCYSMRTCLSK